MDKITYQDIKKAADNLSVQASTRSCQLKQIANELIEAYISSLELEDRCFRDNHGHEKPYIETLIVNEHGKRTLCAVGELAVDNYHEMAFYIRTMLSTNPHILYHMGCHDHLKYVDIPLTVNIKDKKIWVYLLDDNSPIIIPLEEMPGKYTLITHAIKNAVIAKINTRLPQ